MLSLHCAYLTSVAPSYLGSALEIMGRKINLSPEMKFKVYNEGVLPILNKCPPKPLNPAGEKEISEADESWKKCFGSSMTVDLGKVSSCIELRVSFAEKSCPAYSPCPITLHLRNNFTMPLHIGGVCLKLTAEPQKSGGPPLTTEPIVLKTLENSAMVLEPDKIFQIVLPFCPSPLPAEVKSLKVSSVWCTLLPSNEALPSAEGVVLLWQGPRKDVIEPIEQSPPPHTNFGLESHDKMKSISVINELTVISREPQIDIDVKYDSSGLVWEWLEVLVTISSKEKNTIKHPVLGLSLASQPGQQNLEQTTQISSSVAGCSALSGDTIVMSSVSDVTLPDIEPSSSISTTLYIKCLTATTRNFSLTVSVKK